MNIVYKIDLWISICKTVVLLAGMCIVYSNFIYCNTPRRYNCAPDEFNDVAVSGLRVLFIFLYIITSIAAWSY
jgi:hypothetical protein